MIARGTSGEARGTGSTTQTISNLAVGTPENGILFALVANGDDDTIGVTWNGVSMTLVQHYNVGDAYALDLYAILAPTGTHDIVATQTGTGYMVVIAVSYSGVNQSLTMDSKGTSSINNAGSLATSTTVVASDSWVALFGTHTNILTNVTNGTSFRHSSVGSCNATTGPDTYCYDSNGTVSTGVNTLTANSCGAGGFHGILISFTVAEEVAEGTNFFAVL